MPRVEVRCPKCGNTVSTNVPESSSIVTIISCICGQKIEIPPQKK